jgi:hypothetical protein
VESYKEQITSGQRQEEVTRLWQCLTLKAK